MLFKSFSIFGLCLICICTVSAQNNTDPDITAILESFHKDDAEDLDYSELIERLNYYKSKPLNINKTDESALREIGLLSPLQINALINHIQENGPLLDVLELQGVDNFDLRTIQLIRPFISVGALNPLNKLSPDELLSGKHDLLIRLRQKLEKQEGFKIADTSKSRYLGSAQQVLFRYRYQYSRHLSAALNMEKDPGESFFKHQHTGFDFLSGHISFKDIGHLRKLVIGDYNLQFGDALALWSGLSFGKSSQISAVAKQDVGLKPYSSFNEGLFFRGIAATLKWNAVQFTPFYSYRKLDASLSDSLTVSSVNISGLHRTPAELAGKQSLIQRVYGLNAQWNAQNLTLGLTAFQTQFNHSFEPGKELYNQFDFAGNRLFNYSFNYNYVFKSTYLFGEIAHSSSSKFACINGLITSLSPTVSISLLYRNLPVSYHSFYNMALAEASTAINERGFYSGLSIKPNTKWEWSAYADVFHFPWLKYAADAPSRGFDVSSQLSYKPNKRFQLTGLYRFKHKEQNDAEANAINYLAGTDYQKIRLDLTYYLNKNIQIRNRVEMVKFEQDRGYLTYQDLIYNPIQSRFSGNIRFALFNIPTYDARIYAFQNDVLFSNSILAYQYQGSQFYMNGRYHFNKSLDFWIHFEKQLFVNRESIGSGLDEIEGNKRSELTLQVRYQF